MTVSFSASVKEFVRKAKVNQGLALRAVGEAALFRVKELTPVRTGYLRAGWAFQMPVDQISATSTLTIINPVTYAARVEFGFVGADKAGREWHQQGRGMMQQTIAEMPKIAATALAGLFGRSSRIPTS